MAFNLIGVADTQIIVEDMKNDYLPKGLSDPVLKHQLYEQAFSPKKKIDTHTNPYIFNGTYNKNLKIL